MESLTPYQQTAVQITRASNKIATPQQLADYRLAKRPDGSPMYPRYKDMDDMRRISWLGDQFFGLGALTHFQVTAANVAVDATVLDGKIMENSVLREMTLAEMQEAFNNGIRRVLRNILRYPVRLPERIRSEREEGDGIKSHPN